MNAPNSYDGFLIFFVIFVVTIWIQGMRAKENARAAGEKACKEGEVQFLDDTVQKQKTWLGRTPQGWLQIRRLYLFEFASDGAKRYQGQVILHGNRVISVELEPYRI
ncbi:MAG: DUF3301 domain-containing protein [Gammaproteobacteria bacterium]|nr:DUF3301 domain-containing protein [Gammaproteobacteria bacterium]